MVHLKSHSVCRIVAELRNQSREVWVKWRCVKHILTHDGLRRLVDGSGDCVGVGTWRKAENTVLDDVEDDGSYEELESLADDRRIWNVAVRRLQSNRMKSVE